MVASAFMTYAGLGWFRNRARASEEFGRCYASNKLIADLMGQSEATVKRNKKMLEKWQLIFIERRPGLSDYTYFVDDPAEFDAIAKAHGRRAAERTVVAAIEDETEEKHKELAAEAAERSRTPVRGRSPVSYPQVTSELPPRSRVKPTQLTCELRTEDRTERSNRKANRASPHADVRDLSEITQTRSNTQSAPSIVSAPSQAARKMPGDGPMTEADREVRIARLRRQVQGWGDD